MAQCAVIIFFGTGCKEAGPAKAGPASLFLGGGIQEQSAPLEIMPRWNI